MTARRRVALRKAQVVSARKRKGRSRRRKAAITGGVLATMGGLAGARHAVSGSSINFGYQRNDSDYILNKMMKDTPGGKKYKPYAFYTYKPRGAGGKNSFFKGDRVFGGLVEYKGHSFGGRYVHVNVRNPARADARISRTKQRAKRQEMRAFNSTRAFKREVRRTIKQL
jgi:hypothetical protein